MLDDAARQGQQSRISDSEYLALFGIQGAVTAKEALQHIFDRLLSWNPGLEQWKPELSIILSEGTLSERILKALKGDYSTESIKNIYQKLSSCLAQDKMFVP
jgi:carboxylate-amine ligase